jgi:hypothetical protein
MPFAKGGGGEHRFNGARTLKVGLCGNGPACKTSSSKMQDIFDHRQAADVRAYLERRRSSPAVGAALPGTLAGGACPHDGGHDHRHCRGLQFASPSWPPASRSSTSRCRGGGVER